MISLILLFCFLLAFAKDLKIEEIDTTRLGFIKIKGEGFGERTGQSMVRFTYMINDKLLKAMDVDIDDWKETEIVVKTPDISRQLSAEVEIEESIPFLVEIAPRPPHDLMQRNLRLLSSSPGSPLEGQPGGGGDVDSP